MKIDRLIGILAILLQQDKVTAPYLAEKFEVSRRTINRDIEDLCKAGIPLVTEQGKGGGISVQEGYKFDRTLLTSGELQAILAGLRGLDSVTGSKKYQQLMEKVSAGNTSVLSTENHIVIDLASWYHSSLTPKIECIQHAIGNKKLIRFQYISPSGESMREIEPYLLVFHWASWYVWGYCPEREDYRMFKLNRMCGLTECDTEFIPRQAPPFHIEPCEIYPPRIPVKVLFEPQAKWRLTEEFGPETYTEQPDGKLLFQFPFTDKEYLLRWLLGFGADAELLEPYDLRGYMQAEAEKISQKYKKVSET